MVYNELSDIQLWDLTRASNKLAFDQLYARYAPKLITHGYNKFRDRETAKDFMQDIFTRLWDNRETQEFNSSIKQFLYVALRNAFFNSFQHDKVKNKYLDSLLYFSNSESAHADHLICERELARQIEKDLEALPQKMRDVFKLRWQHNLSYKEIAEMQGISVQTVNQHINSARKLFRKKYGDLICVLWMF
jgi:RNA polymerase sigma-70 factor (ECF subfamily)